MAAILRWMFVLALLIVVAGGGAAYWFYTRSDEGLRQLVLEQLRTAAPELEFGIARAQLDPIGCVVRIYGLAVYLPDDHDGRPSLEVQEIVVTLDSDPLTNFNNVVIQKLYAVKPKLHVVRDLDGQWNWLRSLAPSSNGGTPLSVEIENGTIVAEIELPNDSSRELRFENFNVTAHPADANHLAIQVATQLNSSRPMMLEIDAALNGSTWQCKTYNSWRIPFDRKMVQLVSDLSPEFASQASQLRQILNDAWETQRSKGAQASPSNSRQSVDSPPMSSIGPDLGLNCEFDVAFRLQKISPKKPLLMEVDAAIAGGEIHNPLLPFPLTNLGGKIHIDNVDNPYQRKIVVTGLKANNGETTILLDGNVIPQQPMTATVKVREVELNGGLRARLPGGLRRVVNSLGLTGFCNADATITQSDEGWNYQVDLRLANGTLTHERFPLTIRDVSGDLHIRNGIIAREASGEWRSHGGTLNLRGTGKHAGQVVRANGIMQNLGPEQEARIEVAGENLPVDNESLAACPLVVRNSIKSLNLKGQHDVLLRVNRAPGRDQRWIPELIEAVHDGSLNFHHFPYEVQQLRGIVVWKGDLVEFKEIQGVHNGALLTGEGDFHRRTPGPGLLRLQIEATDAAFDRSLEEAMPKTLKQICYQFQPEGSFNASTVIEWVPGTPCVVKLPKLSVRDGRVTMRCFPWSLQNLSGQFAYNNDRNKPGKLEFANLQAQHESTQLIINHGVGWFSSWEPWKLDFQQLDVVNLIPDTTFRNALPEALKKAFDSLQPTGVFSLRGPVSFREQPGQTNSISAEWDLETVLSECSIRAGKRIDSINGSLRLAGKWDGADATIDGELDLDSLWLFRHPSHQGYQITDIHGPFRYRDHQFCAGTEPAKLIPQLTGSPDETKRIRGKFIRGTVYLDTDILLGDQPDYRTFVELKNGKLEYFAKDYLPRQTRLAGEMNGWMQLSGKGSDTDQMVGKGKFVIAPATLYDSPFIVQMSKMLKLQSPERTAFERAETVFTIGNNRFDLNPIELKGDTLSMRGRGYVRFDGGMRMDFGVYLQQFLPSLNPNPYRMRTVEVTGMVGDPKIRTVQFPDLDRSLQQWFNAWDPAKAMTQTGLFDSAGDRTPR